MFIICKTLLQLNKGYIYEGCSEMTLLSHLRLLPSVKRLTIEISPKDKQVYH